jgi:hypothetical protein
MEFNNLEDEINDVNRKLAAEIKKLSPVATGRLKRSINTKRTIETPQGIVAPISLLGYYIFPDAGTKFQRAQRFVERAQSNVIDKEIQDIANAAAEDVANELDRFLPDEIDLTIQL